MVSGFLLWPALRYGTGYQTVWEIRPSAETPSSAHWRRFYFQLTRAHSALELFGRCTLQIYLLTYLLTTKLTTTIAVNEWVSKSSWMLEGSATTNRDTYFIYNRKQAIYTCRNSPRSTWAFLLTSTSLRISWSWSSDTISPDFYIEQNENRMSGWLILNGNNTQWTIKKRDIIFLTITLANLNRFSYFLYRFNREEILHVTVVKFTTSPYLCAHLTS